MRKSEIKTELDQLRYNRDNLSVKINDWKKHGKDVSGLQKELNELRSKIVIMNSKKKVDPVPTPIKKIEKPKKAWPELTYTQAKKILEKWMSDNEYEDEYQFRHSNNFFMSKPEISQERKTGMIHLKFQLQFRSKTRKVVKDIDWAVPYGQCERLMNRLQNLEIVILQKTSDPDRYDQVFGDGRFMEKLFHEKGYDKNGWIIKK